MLLGTYEHSIDAKGRAIMPAKLREDIGESFVITKGLDGCLFAFSKKEWEEFEQKLKSLPLTNKAARDSVRFFLAGAMECEIVKQGRFLISNELRNHAHLDKEIVIVGVITRLEIWNREEWQKYNNRSNSTEDIEQTMSELGI